MSGVETRLLLFCLNKINIEEGPAGIRGTEVLLQGGKKGGMETGNKHILGAVHPQMCYSEIRRQAWFDAAAENMNRIGERRLPL